MADRIPDPVEAKKYLSRKSIVETERWDDLKHGEHAHAFTVAHSRDAGVLNDIFGLLNTAMAEGKSFNSFKGEMKSLMEAKGWYGRSDKGPDDKDYINWRIKLIYHVNMRTAYEAGRYRQQVRGAALRPIWEYVSKLVGKNRREDHIALHGKAFRWDDPFWNEFRPPNGWGCECSVVTLSEAGAEREGIEVLHSDSNGNPPAMTDRNGNAVDWKNFAPPEWKYNPGLEALAPSFGNYKGLMNCPMPDKRSALAHVVDRYREDMKKTQMTETEFSVLLDRIQKPDYKHNKIPLQIGNLARPQHEAMINKARVIDSKIMAASKELYHGTVAKVEKQEIKPDQFGLLYQMFSSPERIFENPKPKSPQLGREFHFVKDTHDGKVIALVFRQLNPNMALRLETMKKVLDEYGGSRFDIIF